MNDWHDLNDRPRPHSMRAQGLAQAAAAFGCALALMALAIALCGCGGPVPVYWVDARAEPTWDRIEDACGFWGLECYETDENNGALTVFLTDYGANRVADDFLVGGETFDDSFCSPAVWATNYRMDLEHEIGHAFGLRHSDDADNVMYYLDGNLDPDYTDKQINKVQRRADMLADCVGN